MKPILNDSDIQPTEVVLQSVMGDNYSNYLSLSDTVRRHGLIPEWHYYNDGKSWLCKMMYKKKNAFWLSVWEDCFKTTFYFTEKDVENISSLPVSQATLTEFRAQNNIGKLIPMIITVKESAAIKEIDTLITYKLSKK